MKQFAKLYLDLDSTNKTNEKVAVLKQYFIHASPQNSLWTLALLSGRRPKRQVNATQLRRWATEQSKIPLWLFEESYRVVGDLAETVALLLPAGTAQDHYELYEWMDQLARLEKLPETEKQAYIIGAWEGLESAEIFVFTKLITGSFRVGIAQNLVVRALAQALDQEEHKIAHKLMGNWTPNTTSFEQLIGLESGSDPARPYPFFLAYPLDNPIEQLENPKDWQAEWKWDGIRSQIIKREGQVFIWTRGEDLATHRFPELEAMAQNLPDGTVLDGEILAFDAAENLSFASLQTRIARKTTTAKLLKEAPVVLYAYDLLEYQGADIREQPLSYRQKLLGEMVNQCGSAQLSLSDPIDFDDWDTLAQIRTQSRAHQAEGLMLKRLSSVYGQGRRRGPWYKWKIEALSVDAVLIYAQQGHGRRANLYTDYTFGVRNQDGKFVTFAKAYSGLTDKEIVWLDGFIRQNTIERFGPVRTVKPQLVFEIGFEGIQISKRHKAGIAVRFPRILRFRADKTIDDADTLETLSALIGTQ